MAIYHFHRSYVSRASGRSSVAAVAYIAAETFEDIRQGVTHNYCNKSDVVFHQVFAPEGTPQALLDHEALWNKAELFEDEIATKRFPGHLTNVEQNRKSLERRDHVMNSARTAFTDNIALPKELTLEQNIALVKEYVNAHYVSHGLAASVAIHWDEGNPHVHIQTTTRTLLNGEFSESKFRPLNDRSFLNEQRKGLADITNKHLEMAGLDIRIDHRSYKDQGLDIQAGRHQGWRSKQLESENKYTRIGTENEEIKQANIKILLEDPTQIIRKVANERAVFTRSDIASELFKMVGGDADIFQVIHDKVRGIEIPDAMDRVANDNFAGTLTPQERLAFAEKLADSLLAGEEAVSLGQDIRNRDIYTSKSYQLREAEIEASIAALKSESRAALSEDVVNTCVASKENESGYPLSEDQRAAIAHVTKGDRISVVLGKAGTGKTTMLEPVAKAYKRAGYRVLGASALGKAVDVMEREIGIRGYTLDSYRIAWSEYEKLQKKLEDTTLDSATHAYIERRLGKLEERQLTSKDVMIVDEANMVGSHLWHPLLRQIEKSGAKLIVVQDPHQLKSVGTAGDIGEMLIRRCGAVELSTIYRQKVDWQREASMHLNAHNVEQGLSFYERHGRISFANSQDSAKWGIISSYLEDRAKNPALSQMVLAFKNTDVKDLNMMIRHQLIEKGELTEHFKVNGEMYSIGDKIVFEENDNTGFFVRTTFLSKVDSVIRDGIPNHMKQGVKNGNMGQIVAYDTKTQNMRVKLDGDNREVVFHTQAYKHFSHGYATTIHKSEGETTDKAYLLVDRGMDANLMLVGATRHRHDLEIFASTETFKDVQDIAKRTSRSDERFSLQDYTVKDENRPYFERVRQYGEISCEKQDILDQINDQGNNQEKLWKSFQSLNDRLRDVAREIVSEWASHKAYAAQLNLRKDVLEVAAGLRARALSDIEVQAAEKVQGYFAIAQETRRLWNEIKADVVPIKDHTSYVQYEGLRAERNRLANDIAAHPRLYKPLVKTTFEKGIFKDVLGESYDEKPGSWQGVLSHSAQYIANQRLEIYKERLDSENREAFTTLESYKETCSQVASLVSRIKAKPSVTIDRSELFTSLHAAQEKRNTLALQIVSLPQRYEAHFAKLKIDEDKLLNYAIQAENQEQLKNQAQSKDDIQDRSTTVLNHEQSFKRYLDADKVLAAANDRLETIVCELLGQPNRALSSPREYRFGQSGKVVYTRTGPKAGLWHDFSTGEGGNIFKLVEREVGGRFQDNVRYIADRIGYNGEETVWRRSSHKEKEVIITENQELHSEQTRKISQVQEQYKESLPIHGTLAETYLRSHRGIQGAELSKDMRYMSDLWNSEAQRKLPALLVFARNSAGEITGRQAIYLNSETGAKANLECAKVSYGVIKGGFVEVQQGEGRTFVAEGIETAVSIKQAGFTGRIVASLGISNIRNIQDANKEIIICADNDGAESNTSKLIDKTVTHLQGQGKTVHIVRPETVGQDYNDVLQNQGVEGVRSSICGQLGIKSHIIEVGRIKNNDKNSPELLESLSEEQHVEIEKKSEKQVASLEQHTSTAELRAESNHIQTQGSMAENLGDTALEITNADQDRQENTPSVPEKPSEPQITTLEEFKAFLDKYDLDDAGKESYLNLLDQYDMESVAHLVSIDETPKEIKAAIPEEQAIKTIEDLKVYLDHFEIDAHSREFYINATEQYGIENIVKLVNEDEVLKDTGHEGALKTMTIDEKNSCHVALNKYDDALKAYRWARDPDKKADLLDELNNRTLILGEKLEQHDFMGEEFKNQILERVDEIKEQERLKIEEQAQDKQKGWDMSL